jgi:hypothetical protein
MGAFGGLVLTNKGIALQMKAQAGAELRYTRVAIGDGVLGSQPIANLTSLISEKISLDITKLRVLGQGRAVIGAVLTNRDLTSGFYFREIGIFAVDPDDGEILYAYANAGSNAEYIPPGGGPDVVEKHIDSVVVVGQAPNVTAVIDQSLVFATLKDMNDHRTAEVLDHPDGSVTTEKLADGAVTSGKMAAGAATDAAIGTRTINDSSAPDSDTSSPTNLWSWLAYMIRAVTGKSNWRTAPATTLEATAAHISNLNNPHGVTKEQVGLGSVQNYPAASQSEAEAGTANNRYMTPQRTKQAIDALAPVKSVAGKTGNVSLQASDISGLGTAATRDVTVGQVDKTTGRVMRVGDFGIGRDAPKYTGSSSLGITANDMGPGERAYFADLLTEDDAVSIGLPALGGAGSTGRAWTVETYGHASRMVQIATEIFGLGGIGRGRTFIRIKHDNTWYSWREIPLSELAPYKAPGSRYHIQNGLYGIDMANSDIIGINGLFFADVSDTTGEGLFFPKTGASGYSRDEADFDRLYVKDGHLYLNNTDYIIEVGNWTPTLESTSGTWNHTYSNQNGRYVRFGNLAFVWGQVALSAKDTGMGGGLLVRGLPFRCANDGHYPISIGWFRYVNMGNNNYLTARVDQNGTQVSFWENGDNVADIALSSSKITNSTTLAFGGVYKIA